MMQAIKEFHLQTSTASEQKLTMRALAHAYNIPFETLRRRIKSKFSTDSSKLSTELPEHQQWQEDNSFPSFPKRTSTAH